MDTSNIMSAHGLSLCCRSLVRLRGGLTLVLSAILPWRAIITATPATVRANEEAPLVDTSRSIYEEKGFFTNYDADPLWVRLDTALRWFPDLLDTRLHKNSSPRRVILKQVLYYTQDQGALARLKNNYSKEPQIGVLEDHSGHTDTASLSMHEKWNKNFSPYLHPFRIYLEKKDSASELHVDTDKPWIGKPYLEKSDLKTKPTKYLNALSEDKSEEPVAYVQFSSGKEVVEMLKKACHAQKTAKNKEDKAVATPPSEDRHNTETTDDESAGGGVFSSLWSSVVGAVATSGGAAVEQSATEIKTSSSSSITTPRPVVDLTKQKTAL
ncbi:unnamed protein product, partial [Amoebophrya sp. A120]|eukprot:GSA120T00014624001.1